MREILRGRRLSRRVVPPRETAYTGAALSSESRPLSVLSVPRERPTVLGFYVCKLQVEPTDRSDRGGTRPEREGGRRVIESRGRAGPTLRPYPLSHLEHFGSPFFNLLCDNRGTRPALASWSKGSASAFVAARNRDMLRHGHGIEETRLVALHDLWTGL